MMTNTLPKSYIEDVHGLQWKFIWGDTDEQRKIHDVGWDSLTIPKALCGIGLENLEVLNTLCIMKLE